MAAARRLLLPLALLVGVLVPAGDALARGGDYTIEGGSLEAQAQVHAALAASRFDWGVVPARITIRITRCGCAGSRPGEIVLDEDALVRSPFGPRYAWGVVQHEYAHQVDWLVLRPRERRALARRLGARAWCHDEPGLAHDDYGCERFATSLAWAYWRSPENVQRPTWERPFQPRPFRSLLARFVSA
ncbi:MAG TPA: hypothetical protein VHF23_07685 [Gaiellaceae bacterium]|nr:hypothetical protein [Gaiellaceae bacterium]